MIGIRLLTALLILFGILGLSETNAYPSRLIDFRLTFSRLSLEDSSGYSADRVNAGVDLTYHFYFNRFVALNFMPGIWLVPLKSPVSEALMWYQIFVSGGLTFRPLDASWMDPTLVVQGGMGVCRAGTLFTRQFNYPLSLRGSLNLFRMVNQYEDVQLALVASAGVSHLLNAPAVLRPRIYDLGLGLRGSF
jgi:hypothetical protein